MYAVVLWLKKSVCLQRRSRNYAWICFAGTSPAINYQPSDRSSSEVSASHITFVLWPQRRPSDLITSLLSQRQPWLGAKEQQMSFRLQNPAVLAQRLAAGILPAEIEAVLKVHPAVHPAVVIGSIHTPLQMQTAHHPAVCSLSVTSTHAPTAPFQMQTAHPVVHPAVVEGAKECSLSVTSTHAPAAPPQMAVTCKSAHPAMGTKPRHRNAMQVILTRYHQNGRDTDVHAALHPNQMCCYLDMHVTAIGTAPYQLHRLPHTPQQ